MNVDPGKGLVALASIAALWVGGRSILSQLQPQFSIDYLPLQLNLPVIKAILLLIIGLMVLTMTCYKIMEDQ